MSARHSNISGGTHARIVPSVSTLDPDVAAVRGAISCSYKLDEHITGQDFSSQRAYANAALDRLSARIKEDAEQYAIMEGFWQDARAKLQETELELEAKRESIEAAWELQRAADRERKQLVEWLRFYSDDDVDVDYMLMNFRAQK